VVNKQERTEPSGIDKMQTKMITTRPVTSKELLEITEEVCKKMSAGIDEIRSDIIRKVPIYITEPLGNMIYAKSTQGLFPTALKRSIINPIHKEKRQI
jgi:hypothetical protein